jgi:UDP-N-acetylmuramyl pentapeptide phosphotransferase/UDP-N-acetylglucosamine-1-phosphate transferase
MIDFSPFIIALFATLVLTPVARMLGLRLGILDIPGELSIHTRSIPRTGGLAMFLGFLVAVGYAWSTGVLASLDFHVTNSPKRKVVYPPW